MAKSVWVLTNGSYSDTHIVGVYSSKENAEVAGRIFRDDSSIEEWRVDAMATEMRRGMVPWFVRLRRETGDVMETHQQTSSYGASDPSVGEDVHKNLYTHVWAKSSLDAIKVASDRRRAFLALPQSANAVDPSVPPRES
jgi:hypothetical protein